MKIELEVSAIKPTKSHLLDAGYDLYAPMGGLIPAHGSLILDTGVHFHIPEGYYGKIESRSGLNIKSGVLCSWGVIDAGFTGSVKIKLYNMTDVGYVFKAGDRMAQIVFMPCANFELETEERSLRGDNGYGSSGK